MFLHPPEIITAMQHPDAALCCSACTSSKPVPFHDGVPAWPSFTEGKWSGQWCDCGAGEIGLVAPGVPWYTLDRAKLAAVEADFARKQQEGLRLQMEREIAPIRDSVESLLAWR